MAIEVRCFLDDTLLDDEPIGLAGVTLSLIRDADLHGIGAEATTSPLEFISNGFEYLENIKNTLGLKALTTFRVDMSCDGEEFQEGVIKGKINYSNYVKKCGQHCSVTVPIESATCEVTLNNRFDQSVNLDANLAFDGLSGLVRYDDLAIMLDLPTRELDYRSVGQVDDAGDDEDFDFPSPGGGSEGHVMARPNYNELVADISDTHLNGASTIGYSGPHGIFIPVSNQVLFAESNISCFPEPLLATGRLKGRVKIPGVTNLDLYGVFLNGELNSLFPINDPTTQLIEQITLGTNLDANAYIEFDWTIAPYNWTPVNNGADGLYLYIDMHQHPGANFVGNIIFDKESFFSVVGVKKCPPTKTAAYMVHETLSRIIESVTDNCCRVKSSYYGRTDSQPFNFPEDGCGGKRFVTSGLKIRNAPNATFFMSPQDAILGLQCIDNIGMGIEPDDTMPGKFVLRVEDLDFFYQDSEILNCDHVFLVKEAIEPDKFYSTINVGYKKWQTLANFGLDEYNSNREYRTSLTSVQSKLDRQCNFVAGEYAIEITREQQFAESDSVDTQYDDDTFIICCDRIDPYGYGYGYGAPYGGIEVEQGNVISPSGIFSPASTYNYRISPFRNLMRLARSIFPSYPNLTDSDNRIYFSKGVGNLQAAGQLADAAINPCSLEAFPVKESQDLVLTAFKDPVKGTPLWENETANFDYPLSISDYIRIKSAPYGFISYQCGNGDYAQGWIVNIKYKIFQGTANFTLRKRWTK